MKLIPKIALGAIALALVMPMLFTSKIAFAQPDLTTDLGVTQGTSGLASESLPEVIGSLISALLAILGVVLLLLIIYAGFLWMTAGGKEEQVKTAKTIMINAVVGLIILLAAYAISSFVVEALVDAGLSG